MEDAIRILAGSLGIDPEIMVALIPIVVILFNVLGRAIPDDSKGFFGVVRKISKVLGLYLSNRVSSGVTVNDVVKQEVEGKLRSVAKDVIRGRKGI